jgi:hypothetical protein
MIHWRDEQGDWHSCDDASGIGMWPTAIVMPVDDEDAAGAAWVAMVTIDEAAPRTRGCRSASDGRIWADAQVALRSRDWG